MSGLPDRRRLTELEGVIERGRQTFVEVGQALAEIRDQRLYRDTHGTFEDYCRERWSMDRRNANRHIEAAAVVGRLGSNDPKPSSVGQTRELARAEDPAATWQRVTEEHGPQPPARVIREAVQAERAPTAPVAPPAPAAPSASSNVVAFPPRPDPPRDTSDHPHVCDLDDPDVARGVDAAPHRVRVPDRTPIPLGASRGEQDARHQADRALKAMRDAQHRLLPFEPSEIVRHATDLPALIRVTDFLVTWSTEVANIINGLEDTA